MRVRDADAMDAVIVAKRMEGMAYDWSGIGSYLTWWIQQDADRVSCAELCATVLGHIDPWRADPCNLPARYGLQP